MNTATRPVLVQRLLDPALYPHPVTAVELIETHISWVLLTGDFAYKIKKPVDLGFLDFSTLELRRHACEEELRLNTRLAPEIYLSVVPVTGSEQDPILGGDGPPLEYAVKMREFPQAAQLDRLMSASPVAMPDMPGRFEQFGKHLAMFHSVVETADPASPYGDPLAVYEPMLENLRHLESVAGATGIADELERLTKWSDDHYQSLSGMLSDRKRGGYIREGHGDLHLRNLVLLHEAIVAFDCIEFSPTLRWIDVINDVAFLFMDLLYHRKRHLALTFLNGWLTQFGDYEGLRLLRFYAVYRALVRAKIAAIEFAQESGPAATMAPDADAHVAGVRRHLELAAELAHGARPLLLITHGVSGSGKTWIAQRLAGELGAVHVRSDVERKRLFGLESAARSAESAKKKLYAPEATLRTYARLLNVAEHCLASGLTVIVDATFIDPAQRQEFADLAARLNMPFVILHCRAIPATLQARVMSRARAGLDSSEADVPVLKHQLQRLDPLGPGETPHTLTLDTDAELDICDLSARVQRLAAEVDVGGSA